MRRTTVGTVLEAGLRNLEPKARRTVTALELLERLDGLIFLSCVSVWLSALTLACLYTLPHTISCSQSWSFTKPMDPYPIRSLPSTPPAPQPPTSEMNTTLKAFSRLFSFSQRIRGLLKVQKDEQQLRGFFDGSYGMLYFRSIDQGSHPT